MFFSFFLYLLLFRIFTSHSFLCFAVTLQFIIRLLSIFFLFFPLLCTLLHFNLSFILIFFISFQHFIDFPDYFFISASPPFFCHQLTAQISNVSLCQVSASRNERSSKFRNGISCSKPERNSEPKIQEFVSMPVVTFRAINNTAPSSHNVSIRQ